ncbi:Fic family protein [Comamonas avium]|uniref:Fic family protein n=1 Tax=Comamonas avium TaxID=2762231 RepID=A0ABR8S7T4_9BURK|nr:DUF4172 domain-containing protein [Comamonas avium]MBD7959538.1 Fic family protein [Comamonas avium]
MIKDQKWVWQLSEWPKFVYDGKLLAPALAEAHWMHGMLAGKSQTIGFEGVQQIALDALVDEVIYTAAIEGVRFPRELVHSSVVRKHEFSSSRTDSRNVDGLVDVIDDAIAHADQPLDADRLCRWQSALFPGEVSHTLKCVVGHFRDGHGHMRIVSGSHGQEVVHYEAPPSSDVPKEMARFLQWFDDTKPTQKQPQDLYYDGFARAAIAHLWFECIHPFEDGNGRVGRAIVSMALAQSLRETTGLYSLSCQLFTARNEYYEALNSAQRGEMKVSDWVKWFIGQSTKACAIATKNIDQIIEKRRFWEKVQDSALNERQKRVLHLLLDTGSRTAPDGLNAEKYMALTGVSKATATRDLSALVNVGQLCTHGVGRALRYYLELNFREAGPHPAPCVKG